MDEERENPSAHTSNSGGLIWLLILIVLAVWLVPKGWNTAKGWFTPDTWSGYFYYAAPNLGPHWKQTGLESLDSCRDWVDSQIRFDFDGQYDYECGKNCKPSEYGVDIDICETTEE